MLILLTRAFPYEGMPLGTKIPTKKQSTKESWLMAVAACSPEFLPKLMVKPWQFTIKTEMIFLLTPESLDAKINKNPFVTVGNQYLTLTITTPGWPLRWVSEWILWSDKPPMLEIVLSDIPWSSGVPCLDMSQSQGQEYHRKGIWSSCFAVFSTYQMVQSCSTVFSIPSSTTLKRTSFPAVLRFWALQHATAWIRMSSQQPLSLALFELCP